MLNPRQTIFTQLSEKMETPNLSDIHTLLTSVGLVPAEKFAKAYPFNLSGGQLQRVLIALALVNRPPLILADEPFSAVDAELKEDLSQLLVSLVTKHNMGLLLVSHDQQLIKRLSDRVLFLDNGQLVGASTAVSQDTVPTKALTTQNQILLEVGQLKKSYAEGGLFSSSKLSQ
jgi:ABC-type glutathione transport system ATPase component